MPSAVKWVVGYGLIAIVSIPINGLLIAATWGWFVVPATGAREIGVVEGIGLSFFLAIAGRAATGHLVKIDSDDERDPGRLATALLVKAVSLGIIAPVATLAIAWGWHTFLTSRFSAQTLFH